ncbi:MAG TPA: metallophosphoesterase [Candidatus Edwardsbacteria bacterium]|nr:metallophosphoesterase [Candidatus Edwardsbacteria bacterium]
MRTAAIAIFISIAILVYGAVNWYIFIRGWQALPRIGWLRTVYTILFVAAAGSFIAGRFLERACCTKLTAALVWAGSLWLAFMLYFFLSAVLLDLARLSNVLFHWWPRAVTGNYARTKLITLLVVVLGTTAAVLAGYVNAAHPRVKKLDLAVDKPAGQMKTLRIAMASDIHLGTIIGNGRLTALVDRINALQPDVILLCGDIVDEDIGSVIRDNLGETLRKLHAKYGVYGITGNHEYIGGAKASVEYLRAHGVTMLMDSVALIDSSFYLAGRIDRSGQRFEGRLRRSLPELLQNVDRTKPVILLDHQPFELDKAEAAGVDLQLSGHTHHGQLWPFNLITNAVYELSWGYKRKGNTHFYVSSGYGTWGPPVRTGNTPEIVDITLRFIPR